MLKAEEENMMKNTKLMVLLAGLVASPVVMAEQVDVLFLVEPNVYQTLDREKVHSLIQSQLDEANSLHSKQNTGINYNAIAVLDWKDNQVSESLSQGESFAGSAGNIIYSVRFTEPEYDSYFDGLSSVKPYEKESYDLFRKYHADNVVFISSGVERDTRSIGYAIQNMGVVVGLAGLEIDPYLLAHEWGHNIGLGHTSVDECSKANHLMCADASNNGGLLTYDELERVKGVVAKDSTYFVEHFDSAFYLGWYSEPQQKVGKVKFSVLDNPIENTVDSTEAIVELVDAQGEPLVFEETVSIEVFTEAGTASAGANYDADVYQRVEFAPGESTKRLDLGVTHGTSDLNFKMGARYGLYLNDSNVVGVTINATKDSGNGGDTGGDNSGSSSGGSLGFFSLLLLACLGRFRR